MVKPCPFCGQLPDDNDMDFCHPITRPTPTGERVWRAGCIESMGGCGAEVTGMSKEEAITRWNNRV